MQQKTEQINLRTTKDEKKALQQKSEERGFKNLSEFILCSIIKPERLNTKKFMGLLYELNKIGVNLNQISRKCNEQNSIDVDVLQSLEYLQEQMNILIKGINNAS